MPEGELRAIRMANEGRAHRAPGQSREGAAEGDAIDSNCAVFGACGAESAKNIRRPPLTSRIIRLGDGRR